MNSHSDNLKIVEVGKIGITGTILKAENISKIKINVDKGEKISTAKITDTWLSSFIKILTANVKKNEIENIFSNLAIICFNYDRCIEHALHELLQLSFGLDQIDATKCMKNLAITHPYGTVGNLPWENRHNPVPFGDCERNDLAKISEDISIFTERKESNEFIKFIDEHVPNAELIMFLGYGYYKQNMDLISRTLKKPSHIIGSAKGLSSADRLAITTDLKRRFSVEKLGQFNTPQLENMTCFEMMNAYSRLLATI